MNRLILSTLFLMLYFIMSNASLSLVVSSLSSDPNNFDMSKILTTLTKSPNIYEVSITTNVSNRYAETVYESKVQNTDLVPKQAEFSVVLPENAFITGFIMDVGGKSYKAFVKEKEEAKNVFKQSTTEGATAAHVAVHTRNANRFTITINVEAKSNTTFRLYYEEMLVREHGQYEIVTNIQPGQIVEKLTVNVTIQESRRITFVKTPELRTGSILSATSNDQLNPLAQITTKETSAKVLFKPSIRRQVQLICAGLGSSEFDGFAGQFIVQYDVQRSEEGEILTQDGYFVNFFAVDHYDPLPKHIVFVLDTSGSMSGQKLDNLKVAMANILPQLQSEDLLNIVEFSTEAYVWNMITQSYQTVVIQDYKQVSSSGFNDQEEQSIPNAIQVTPAVIKTATNIVQKFQTRSSTNIIVSLEISLHLIEKVQKQSTDNYLPIVVFLTDGEPNEGISESSEITNMITEMNTGRTNAYITCLSFGEGANVTFLENLAKRNSGFHKHIDDATDASIELEKFFDIISKPTLKNITFGNLPQTGQVSKTNFPVYFNGSEMIVVGKGVNQTNITISATGKKGLVELQSNLEIPRTRLERLWAYVTVKQALEERDITNDIDKRNALQHLAEKIALEFNFVTQVSSLVVVKPNETGYIDVTTASGIQQNSAKLSDICNTLSTWVAMETTTTEEPTTTEHPTTTEITTTEVTTTKPTTTAEPTEKNLVEIDYTEAPEIELLTTTTSTTTTTTAKTTTAPRTCHNSKYGCCLNGITYAKGSNYFGCEPTHSSNDCSLPSDRGLGRDFSLWYFFNTSSGMCTPFWYGGTGGNSNRFESKEACENYCVNAKQTDRCSLPKSSGMCRSFSVKWYYNKERNHCEKFAYSGCMGNMNRFETKKDCSKLCVVGKTPLYNPQEKCSLPKVTGNCSNVKIRYYFDQQVGTCKRFYFRCNGNQNNFKTQKKCEEVCVNPKGIARCKTPKIKGSCNNNTVKWYYDYKSKECLEFTYGGCLGNTNRFDSRTECLSVCKKTSTNSQVYPQDVCVLTSDRGPCNKFEVKWHYDKSYGGCNRFWYGGCDGNSNRFNSEQACVNVCVSPQGFDVCNLHKEKGPCSRPERMWYYDRFSDICSEFEYGGCNGNSNKFKNQQECADLCINRKKVFVVN